MKRYAVAYGLGVTPWERYGVANAERVAALLDREEADRGRPPGRALDLGCGRGQYTPELARRGWDAMGIDDVRAAVVAAREADPSGAEYVVGDVTELAAYGLGTFDFFLDVGCFQGLDPDQRLAVGRGVTELANPGATLLMLAFGPTWLRAVIEGVSRAEVEAALPGWEMLSAEPAGTAGLGWPMSRTRPQWYRLRVR